MPGSLWFANNGNFPSCYERGVSTRNWFTRRFRNTRPSKPPRFFVLVDVQMLLVKNTNEVGLFSLHRGLSGWIDFADFSPSFCPFSPLLVFSTNKTNKVFYFVGEKHQRRLFFLSASRIERIEGFRGFFSIFLSLFALVGVVTNKPKAFYFVGEKHQRRRSFLSASQINRIEGFRGFFAPMI